MKRPQIQTTPAAVDALTRRALLHRTAAGGLAALVAGALPAAQQLLAPAAARAAQDPGPADATLQAFFDTMIPGRPATTTSLGHAIHPRAILGVDGRPGAVEADALAVAHHPLIGFDALAGPFLVELEALSVAHGGTFLSLDWDGREAVCTRGLAFDNPVRLVWEAAAAVPFAAFCAAAIAPAQTAERAPGYAVMGLPGARAAGYANASYRRRLAHERTPDGNLP